MYKLKEWDGSAVQVYLTWILWSPNKQAGWHFFGKSSTEFGINEQGGQIYSLNLISEQGKNLQVWWKKKSQKAKRACSYIVFENLVLILE